MTSSTKIKHRKVIIDPTFAAEWRDVSDFLNEFGPYNGRYVPSYPYDWEKRLKKHIEELDLSPVKKLEMLTKIREQAPFCTVPAKWAWDDAKTWKDNCKLANVPTDTSIVIGDAYDPQPFYAWQDAIDEIRASRTRSFAFSGSIAEYSELCRPLLLASPAVYLVDPYLNPFDFETEMLLRNLFQMMKGSCCYSLEIIRRWPFTEIVSSSSEPQNIDSQSIEQTLTKSYQSIVPKGRSFKLHCVVEGRGNNALRMHDRFFLTKHGGLNFGHGFKIVGKELPHKNAFVVDAEHLNLIKKTYIDGVAYHRDKRPQLPAVPMPRDVITFSIQGNQ